MTINKCLVCDSDQIAEVVEDVPLKVGEFERTMRMRATACASCGCSFHSAEQERFNKRQRLAFRKMVEGLLTGVQIRAIRERHGLSQKRAAEVFGGGPVAFSKYEADDVAQSQAMDRLLRVFDAVPEAKAALMGKAIEAEADKGCFKDDGWIQFFIAVKPVMLHSHSVRRSLIAEEELKESLSFMLKHHEVGTATRNIEWQPAKDSAQEWRH